MESSDDPEIPLPSDDQKNKGRDSVPKTKRQIKEEKQKELERVQQQKREAEAKAKADIYRFATNGNIMCDVCKVLEPFDSEFVHI